MSTARQTGIAAALRAARSTPPQSPADCTTGTRTPRRIVGTASLRRKPAYIGAAPTAFEFYDDPGVLVSTPVEEGRESEHTDHIAYSSTYAADLVVLSP